ncbi:hypothetical protein [Pseudomonas laurylsulfatiphila]|uniref:hypothetical protein n=1 Tax=Pseudomonas laurylsulfatiphila TaxID=2011015 RepID=UPI003D1DF565
MIKLKVGQTYYDFNQLPDECPHCHHAIKAEVVSTTVDASDNIVDMAFVCPRHTCRRASIAVFKREMVNPIERGGVFQLRVLYPRNPIDPDFSEHVAKVSTQYVEIFTQASKAEAFGLGEIAGVGYRKALEFLVKDYCITKYPDNAEDIKKIMLSPVIQTYVDNENIKKCAQRASWLGNDETHYVRKWVDKDINDLKGVIKLVVAWIEQEIQTEILLREMQ